MQQIRRLLQAVTIDGPGARDLDDAFMVKRLPNGRWLVEISIADVAARVPPGSALDRQARARGFSLYAGSSVRTPMLPPDISFGAASLLPGRPRQAVTLRLELDPGTLELRYATLERTLVDNIARLTYAEAATIISDGRHILHPVLAGAAAIASELFEKRRRRGAIALYDAASGWMSSEEGALVEIGEGGEGIAHLLVQELMILANVTIAELMHRKNVPLLHRSHALRLDDPAAAEALADIELAIATGNASEIAQLRVKAGHLFERARYTVEPSPHFALGFERYVHFTSPLRRYADLVNHRMVVALIDARPPPYTRRDLAGIADHLATLEEQLRRNREIAIKDRLRRQASDRLAARNFAGIDLGEFGRVLRVALEEKFFPPELEAEVRRRIEIDDIAPKDAARLLYHPAGVPDDLREAVCRWLYQRPYLAPAIWGIARQHYGFPEASVDANDVGGEAGELWVARASAETPGEAALVSAPATRPDRRLAEQLAMASLAVRAAGIALPIPDSNDPASELPPIAGGPANLKGRLIEHCRTKGLPMPRFEVKSRGPLHSPVFTAVVRLALPEGELVSPPAEASSRRAAEHQAARHVLEQLLASAL